MTVFSYLGAFAQDEKATAVAEAEPDKEDASAAGAGSTEKKLDEVPLHLSVTLDEADGRWDPLSMGAFVNGSRCFNGAMLLANGDDEFEVEEVWEDATNGTYRLKGMLGGLKVERRIVIDKQLGAARCLDIFHNTSDEDLEAVFSYTVGLFYEPANFFTSRGKELGKILGSRDFGLAIEAPADGDSPGVLLVLAHERSEHKPTIIIAEDKKTLNFDHDLKVKAGQKVALLHWVVQKKFLGADDLEAQFAPLYENRRLVAPAVGPDHLDLVANFPAGYEATVGGADYLVAANELTDRLQLERATAFDQLRVENGSVLTGDATGGDFTVASRFGDLEVPVAEVAILQGGGGVGRGHRVFLRNGAVYAGEVAVDGLGLNGGYEVSLTMPQFDYLLYRLADSDGEFPQGTEAFVSLHSGDILPVTAAEGLQLALISPWGRIDVPMAEVQWLRSVKEPSPRYRLSLRDGSQLTVFLDPGMINVRAGALGEQSFSATEVAAMWGAEVELPKGFDALEEVAEITKIPKSMAGGACLLSGSNLIAGVLGNRDVHVLTGATVTKVKLADVVRMSRNEEAEALTPIYDIELRGGDKLTGMLQERVLDVQSAGRSWRVPVQHFLAMRSTGAPAEVEIEEEAEEEKKGEAEAASRVPGRRSVVLPPKP